MSLEILPEGTSVEDALSTITDGEEEPSVSLRTSWGYIEFELNRFYFLKDRLDYDPRLDAIWQRWDRKWEKKGELSLEEYRTKFGGKRPNWSQSDTGRVNHFPVWLYKRCPKTYGFGAFEETYPVSSHTYNEDNLLSGDLYVCAWNADDEGYAIIASADPYGIGHARLFTVDGDLEGLFDYNRGTICCGEGHVWDHEEGWKDPDGDAPDLDDFPIWDLKNQKIFSGGTKIEDLIDGATEYARYNPETNSIVVTQPDLFAAEKVDNGYLIVLPDETMLCPHCSSPLKGFVWPP